MATFLPTANAQQEGAAELEEIVVTGSRIARRDFETPTPLATTIRTVRCPMSLAREVVRQRKKNLRVCGQGVLELDLWLAAGLVKKLDITYIGLEVYGTTAALRRAVESGDLSTLNAHTSLSKRIHHLR